MARFDADFDFVVPDWLFEKAVRAGHHGGWVETKIDWGVRKGDCVFLRSFDNEAMTLPFLVISDMLEREDRETGEPVYYVHIREAKPREASLHIRNKVQA